jgi:hypothetical protein
MADNTRIRMSAVAVKTETTGGVDAFAGTPALTDFIGAELSFTLPQQTVEDPSLTGSFDRNAPIPTGIRPTITLRMPFRGSGQVATAPEWARLLQACRFEEVQQVAAVGAPTAATAGTVNTLTLAAPYAATAQAYRGMPVLLTGTPAGVRPSIVMDYTTGRVAKLAETYATALGTGTLAQVPANWLYRLTDDDALMRPVTIYGYRNGLRWRFVGCVGSVALEMSSGQPGFITFSLRGQLLGAYEAVAMPVGWNSVLRPMPPPWLNGLSRLDGVLARCARFSWADGNTMYDPENPEAPQGFDAPIITGAANSVTLDPFSTTTNSPGRFGKFQVGSSVSYGAMLGATVGNRIAISNPSLRITAFSDANRGELGVDNLTLMPDVPGQGMFISVY